MKHDDLTAARRRRRSDLRWSGLFLGGAIVLALIGEPQPLAILTAGASFLTGAYLLFRPAPRR
jgi:hypothetical protein